MRARFLLWMIFLPSWWWAQQWTKLQQQASDAANGGEFQKAIELSEKALQLALKDKKADKQEVLSLRSENAAYLLLDEQIDNGMSRMEAVFAEIKRGAYSRAEMNASQNLGIALSYLGRPADALPYLERVIVLSEMEKLKTEDKVNVLASIAVCYQSLYQYAKAEQFYKQAADLCAAEKMTATVDYAFLMSNMALFYKDTGMPFKCIQTFEKAGAAFRKAGDTVNAQYAVYLSDYSGVLAEHDQHQKALELLFRSRNLTRQLFGEQSNEYAAALNNIGEVYSRMNRLVETEQFYTDAIRIRKSLNFVRPEQYYTSVSNLMVFYATVGRKQEALELAKTLEEGLQRRDFTDTVKRAIFAHNLAIRYYASDIYDKSYRYYKDAILYYTAVYGADHEKLAELYVDMATLFQVQRKFEDCTNSLQKAAEIYKKNPNRDQVADIPNLCNIALILRGIEKPKEAEPYVNKALELVRTHSVSNVVELQQVNIVKAMVMADLERVQEALNYFKKYLDLKYADIEKSFSYMTENEKMFYLDEFENQIRNFYTTILNHIDQFPELSQVLLDFRIKTKGFLLNNISKIREQIRERNDPTLIAAFEELKLKRETVSKLMSFDTQEYPFALAEAAAINAEADKLEKEISLKVTGTGNTSLSQNWQSIQKLLKPGEAAIEVFQSYLIYDKGQGRGTNYTFIILKDKGTPSFVSIDRPMTWEENVLASYRASIETKNDPGDVYQRLWLPVNLKLQDVTTVYVSPDGIYNQVNLNSLLNKTSGRYLIEEKEIHVLTSLRDLQAVKALKNSPPSHIVLFGNPAFDYDLAKLPTAPPQGMSTTLAQRSVYGFKLTELPGTKTEVEVISQTLKKYGVKVEAYTEEKANENTLKKIVNPDVLHLATHGFFLEDPKEEDLMGYSTMEKEFYTNPMMRSGIFLTGANNDYHVNSANVSTLSDYEDGMITASEAMNLKLDKTQLIVLSACQTGLGKVKNGEGVFGLQRAFRLAGAKSIIMSLWPVSDEATKDLMIAFYEEWSRSGDVYKAFRYAQLEVKKKYPQPYYWGAFVLCGR